jgi:membrane dipeptidase
MNTQADAARALHEDSLIIDGLIFHCDGYVGGLRAGNVAAINLTVSHFVADFVEACDNIAALLDGISRPGSPWHIIETTSDILKARAAGKIGLIMGWQNMRPIDDRLDRLAFFHRLGMRVMQLTYNERNFMGDGCLEPEDGGLSALGKRATQEMNRLGIALDLSHVGQRTSLEAVEASTKPTLLTHANGRAVTPALRNKTDEVIKAVAAGGGLVGVSVYGPMCWDGDPGRAPDLSDFVRHADYIAELVGPENMAFGTDFPSVAKFDALNRITGLTLARYPAAISDYAKAFGNTIEGRALTDCRTPADLPAMTAALLDAGWTEADLRGLLGLNMMRVLAEIWGA